MIYSKRLPGVDEIRSQGRIKSHADCEQNGAPHAPVADQAGG